MLQDIYPDGLEAIGALRPYGMVAGLWRFLNRRAFVGADEIWALGRDMRDLLCTRYGLAPRRIRYVPHWSSVEVVQPKSTADSKLHAKLGLRGKFVVQYSGNMGLWHDLAAVVAAAVLLREERSIHFVLIGDGIRRPGALAAAETAGLENITWLPYIQDRAELEDALACCDAALISQLEGLEGIAVPCKLYGILASGRAIVAQVPQQSEVALVVQEESCGIVVNPGDVAGLAEAIRLLSRDASRVASCGRAAFEAFRSLYTVDTAAATFSQAWREWTGAGLPADGVGSR
jgi:glycosyltransferase involved in cell wall biosynthesis